MSTLRLRLLLGVAILTLVPCTAAWCQAPAGQKAKPAARPPRIPDNVVLEADVQYGTAGDRPLLLDILRPKLAGGKRLPVIAFIHGGGWGGGSKEGARGGLLPFVASGNYLGVTIEYRLSGVATWPAQIHDCKAAIRWLRANTKKYNLDPEKIGVWGDSAGGHLVSMLGLTGGVKELEGDCGSPDQSSRVACVVDFYGPSDFLGIAAVKGSGGRNAYGPVSKLLGGRVEEKRDLAKAASPLTYASKDAAPLLIVHGTDDKTVPLSQAESLYVALKKAGADVTFVKILGGGHGHFGCPALTQRVTDFLDKHLRGQNVQVSGEPIDAPPPPTK